MPDMSLLPEDVRNNPKSKILIDKFSDIFYNILTDIDKTAEQIGLKNKFGPAEDLQFRTITANMAKIAFDQAYGRYLGETAIKYMFGQGNNEKKG